MKYINNIGKLVVAGIVLAATSCSDFDDYNSVPVDDNAMASKTLYENISENANLKDFAAIIKKANYDKALSAAQCYTLWAPLDGTYEASAILAMDSATIVNKFINMHIAQFSHPVSGDVDKRIITLNDKHHSFSNSLFDGIQIKEANIPATNGLIHTINGSSPYYPNIYEYLDEVEGCSYFADYIHSKDTFYVDKNKSIEGPMVNGQQTYTDTVWAKTNPVIRRILKANIEDEDSTFTALFPTDYAWEKANEAIRPLYKYLDKTNYMDVSNNTTAAASLKETTAKVDKPVTIDNALYCDSLPKYHILRHLAFSNSYKQNQVLVNGAVGEDSLYTATNRKLSNVEEIVSHCGPLNNMSNGYVRTLDSICFKPWETYEPIIKVLEPIRTLDMKAGLSYTMNTYGKDSLIAKHMDLFSELPDFAKTWILPKNGSHLSYISTDSVNIKSNSAKPEFAFALDNVLSTKYHIYVVLVPSQLKEPERPVTNGSTQSKDLYLRFDMSYTDDKGDQKLSRINVVGAKKATDDILVVNDGKFHVLELEFTFPICYYGIEAFPTLFMSNNKTFTSSANRRKFEQELRVAGVYLVPEGAYNHVQSLKF